MSELASLFVPLGLLAVVLIVAVLAATGHVADTRDGRDRAPRGGAVRPLR